MRRAITVMSIGWGAVGLLIVAMGVLEWGLPRSDDLGVGILVVSTFIIGLRVAAIVMLAGACMGVCALAANPAERTSRGIAAIAGTVLVLVGLACFLSRFSWIA